MPYSDPEVALRQRRLWREKNREDIRQKNKVWREANKERYSAKLEAWRSENLEKVSAAKAKWRDSNRGVISELSRAHYEKNKESILRYSKEWRKENKERSAQTGRLWIEANRDKRVAIQARRRAAELAAPGRFTSDDVMDLFGDQDGLCECGADLLLGYHVDHKQPLSRGGSNWPYNLQLRCPTCNLRKNSKTENEWQYARYKETLK